MSATVSCSRTSAQAFQTAGVKLVDKDGKPTLANIEETVN